MNLEALTATYGSRNEVLGARYTSLAAQYEGRQWHQLTQALEELVADETCWFDRNMIDLANEFISLFESKLSPLRYVKIYERISRQFFGNPNEQQASTPSLSATADALEFMRNVQGKSWLTEDARVVAKMCVVELLVSTNDEANIESGKQVLEETKGLVATFEETAGPWADANAVQAAFHRAEAAYYRSQGPAGEYYRSTTRHLAHVNVNALSTTRKRELARDVCLSVLVAKDIFDFGEVLAQPVVTTWLEPSHVWLRELIERLNVGDVDGFNACAEANQKVLEQTRVISLELLKRKVVMMSVVRLCFDRKPEERDIEFEAIAKQARIPVDQVEWVLMQCFSNQLLKGKIDGVRGVVEITWLRPHVLDAAQLATLVSRIDTWSDKVKEALVFEQHAPELFASVE